MGRSNKTIYDLRLSSRDPRDESFGLLMEGLYALREFSLQAEKTTPDSKVLTKALDDALENLGECEVRYPKAALPLYSLGLALTMKNQLEYAKMLADRAVGLPKQKSPLQAQLEKCQTELKAARKRLDEVEAGEPASPEDLAQAHAAVKKAESARDTARDAINKLSLRRLPDRPWPLLDHAAQLFDTVAKQGPGLLYESALFNLAQVQSKREQGSDLDEAHEHLQRVEELLQGKPPDDRSWRRRWRRWRHKTEAQPAANRELAAMLLQAKVLRTSVELRIEMKLDDVAPVSLDQAMEPISREIDSEDLKAPVKNDLRADLQTKMGFLFYTRAVTPGGHHPHDDLESAEKCLRRALYFRKNWNPAQIYLAQVLQAQTEFDEAEKVLKSVVGGKPPKPAKGENPGAVAAGQNAQHK